MTENELTETEIGIIVIETETEIVVEEGKVGMGEIIVKETEDTEEETMEGMAEI